MRIHFLISTTLFILFTLIWILNYPDFEFKGTNFKDKFDNFQFTFPIILYFFKFIIGITLSLLFFSFIANIISSNVKTFFKNKFSDIFLIIVSWLIITSLILSITSLVYPNLFFSHKAWTNQYLALFLSITIVTSLSLSFFIKKNRIKTILLLSIIAFIKPMEIESLSKEKEYAPPKYKNVIIIGIDSLNTALVNKENTPFIHEFVNTSLHLPNTYTHVARTFPSWVTILTGDYPTSNGARLNLTNLELLNLKETLPYFLKKIGYKTYFSLDERRFSHIDSSFYFDKVIGPPETVDELVLSQLVENPMLAITSQLPLLKDLMPQLYNNRGSWKNYSPTSFSNELEDKIKNEGIPVFISSHFTLPHWPYKTKYNTSDSKDTYGKYIDSIKLADKQVHRYMEHLNKEGLLNDSIVFIITDHGESFGRNVDQPRNGNDSMNIPGHGNSIVSRSQFNVLLSLKVFREGNELKRTVKNKSFNFALTDITPTVFDILELPEPKQFDGQSIFKVKSQRSIPLESSLKPSFNSNGSINLKDTIRKGISLYNIDKQGRAVIKDTIYEDLVNIKQRGVIFDKWQLSIYPELNNSLFITDLEEEKLYKYSDFQNKVLAKALLKELCTLFSKDQFKDKSKYCKNVPYLLVNGNVDGKAI
ncbi:sulfatase-like hydrolase/transferase [Pseudoalteromonas sp. BZK2]|uniref:sulfatase-like hydrolase/transferase n=1 Tax=Pseudoalteromonas sp. BZK2 TaxID=1904458 RepID=UPI001654BFF9|nr:sulfatase-like hydrolase/transferase [Pseudoalteromonas sp. BZK2]MBC7008990.1 sulfatase-like hydrolase/transferase [Pseudoalteromonas sp. BZK2]